MTFWPLSLSEEAGTQFFRFLTRREDAVSRKRKNWSGIPERTEVESKTGRTFTRSLRASSLTEDNKSALTDHATQENHVINWSQATVIDREPERFTRWIKGAIHIRKEGQQAMNRDEGSYQLNHAYDRFLDTASSCRVKNRKNWVPASSNKFLS